MLEPSIEQLHSGDNDRHNERMVLLTMTASMVEALKNLEHANGNLGGEELARRRLEPQGNVGDGREGIEESTKNDHHSSANAEKQPTEPSMVKPKVGNPISHGQVVDICRDLKARGIQPNSLEALLKGSKVYVPPPPPKAEPVSRPWCFILNLELIFLNRHPSTKRSWHVSVVKKKNDPTNA
jgi:hypothetical protein